MNTKLIFAISLTTAALLTSPLYAMCTYHEFPVPQQGSYDVSVRIGIQNQIMIPKVGICRISNVGMDMV